MNIMPPKVGRKVWFRPNGVHTLNAASFSQYGDDQPLDATVAYVWNDRMVNLQVIDHDGIPHAVRSVVLLQPGDGPPVNGFYAEWMPYQIDQAKKKAT